MYNIGSNTTDVGVTTKGKWWGNPRGLPGDSDSSL